MLVCDLWIVWEGESDYYSSYALHDANPSVTEL